MKRYKLLTPLALCLLTFSSCDTKEQSGALGGAMVGAATGAAIGNTEGAIALIRDTLGDAAAEEAVVAMAAAEVPETANPVEA